MTFQWTSAITRIRQPNNRVVGAGFLVSNRHILTCAHVVNAALGKQLNTPDEPNQEIDLDFPLVASGKILRAKVVRWRAVQPTSSILPEAGADIALLELESSLPEKTNPVRLVKAENLSKHPFEVFGFPEGRSEGVSTNGIISNPQANGRVQIEVVGAYPIESGFSGSPVWDEQLDGVVGMTVAIDPKRPQVRVAFIIPTTQLIDACPELEEQAIPPCPYRGLFAFREQDAKFFFGRETFTQQLVQAVQRQSLVAVIGASGSGKSSVVFAGLIPQLRSEKGWLIEDFRPGDRPLRNLAKKLVALRQFETIDPLDQIDQMLERFQEGKRNLRDVIEDILERNNRTRLLLIADQFEEVYTLCQDKSERQIFLDLFLEAVNQTENFTFVLTLRADFCGYALSYRPFADALQDADRKIGPMNRAELQKVIEKPAELLGVRIESGLTERILEGVEDEPGYLPLLEFALTLLWAKQQNAQLTHEAYESIGGVEKALAEYAEEQYQNLSEEDKQRAQRVFIQLVRPGEGTEDTRRLATSDEVGASNWNLVTRKEGLADARLVVTNKTERTEGKVEIDRETVEIIHEALILEWGTLRGWIELNREFRIWQERLKVRMQEWEKSGRNDGALLRRVPLGEAEEWLHKRGEELSQTQRDFVQLSLTERNTEKEERKRQEREKLEAKVAFETSEEKNRILAKANQKANRRICFGSGVLAISFIGAIIAGVIAGIANQQLQALNRVEATFETILGRLGIQRRGIAYYTLGDFDRGIGYLQKSLEFARKIKDRRGEGYVLGNLGIVYHAQGQYKKAINYHEQHLAIAQETEYRRGEGQAFSNLGIVYQALGNYNKAIDYHQQHLAIALKIQNRMEEGYALGNLGIAYQALGNYNKAIEYHQQHLAIAQKIQDSQGEAQALGNLGLSYQAQGEYRKAEPLYQKAIDIQKNVLGEKHPDVASSLDNLAGVYKKQSKYMESESVYKKALAIRQQKLGNNHPNVADSFNDLALLYQSQGRYTEAERLFQQSLAIRKEKLGNNHPDIAESLNDLAVLYYSQGKYTEVEPLFQESLTIRKEKLGDNHPEVARSLNNLAALYYSQGRYTEVEPLFQQSLAIWKEKLGDNHPDVATSLNNLAFLYYLQERYTEAEILFQESLAIKKEKLPDNHPSVAKILNNLARLYYSQGKYTEAEILFQESLAIKKEKLGDNHPSVAKILNNLARLYYSQGKYTEAERLFQQSLAIRKEKLGDNHPDVAESLNNLAELYYTQGKYTEVEPLFQESLAIRKEKLGDNHPDVAKSLNNLAELYYSQEKYTEAKPLFQESLAIRKEKLGDNHPDVAKSLNDLAELYQSQGNTTRAIELLSQAIVVEERNLSKNLVVGDERQKQNYMRTIFRTTNGTISLNLQSAPNNLKATRLALKTIFERKGRILDVLTNSLQILRQRTDDSDTQELLNQFIAKRTQLSNLIFKKLEDFPSPEVYRELLANVEKEAKELEGKLSDRSAEFGNLSQPITLEKIQQQIPPDTALVELFRYQPFNPKAPPNKSFGKPRYAAYILYQTGEPQAIDLGEAEPIDKKVDKLRKYLRNKLPLKQIKRSARELDEIVMQPVRQLLEDTKTILLSPDAALNLIPFEALVDENNQYLVENYQITYLTSGRDLLSQNPKSNRQTPLVIANPNYEQQGEIVFLNNYRSVEIDLSDFKFPALGGTQQEAETITQLFPEALTLTKTKATENALKQVKNPDFLHIATHGFFLSKPTSENSTDFDNPLFRSGLVFAGVEKQQSGGDDGVFTAYEATLLNLVGTQLVVLSACETGIGDISAMEGIYGLRRAFVIAGSESQMISLWKVEDEATKDLMVAYYQGLKAGKGRRDALLEIQRDWLQEGEYQHPYYWASFIFSGDGKPMEF